MAAFIRRLIQGRAPDADAAVATLAADGETSQPTVPSIPASGQSDDVKKRKRKPKCKRAGIYLPLSLYRAVPDNQPIVPSPPTITASGELDNAKKRKPKPKRKLPIENDDPRKVPKLKSETSECDRVCLPGHELATDNRLAATPEPESVSAVRGNTRSIHLDVPNYQGMDIAWNLSPNGTVSGFTFSFDGSTS
ncbi:hypothetical protein FN846DRAFT_903981 [Sphaerosporella brunnea]|uniref:Uncharacterized protein n=1 Tax=Sphaerosporella brunnea TaxID=1250544 RepID=A0A5J5F5I2_9PEZI|nr:hypothetical protein FN846DRAFT_903981 [Sphaerosporella brunnea]